MHTIHINNLNTDKTEFECINEDNNFWGRYYLVSMDNHTGWDSAICVNAENEQDALDYAADYAEEKGWMGYFVNPDDELYNEYPDEYLTIGNHGLLVKSDEINIMRVYPIG